MPHNWKTPHGLLCYKDEHLTSYLASRSALAPLHACKRHLDACVLSHYVLNHCNKAVSLSEYRSDVWKILFNIFVFILGVTIEAGQ